jgi:hypothetical protein
MFNFKRFIRKRNKVKLNVDRHLNQIHLTSFFFFFKIFYLF